MICLSPPSLEIHRTVRGIWLSGGATWSPLALSPLRWWDASQLGLSDGASIAQLTDYSGNSGHFVQSTTSKKFLYVASGINGIGTARSDGVDDVMTLTSPGSQAAWTAFIVFKQTTVDTGENTFWSIADSPSASNFKMLEKAAGVDGVAGCYINGNPIGAVGFVFTAGTLYGVIVTANASGLTIRNDKGSSTSNSNNHSRGNDIMRLGARGDGNYAPMDFGEAAFWDRVLTSDEIALLWSYAATKWGTSIP